MSDTKQNITIKKYANRRLYNTATSSYVTLEDLSAMVKNGENFNVYDAKTSEDITRSVLTQIIVEEENKSGQQNLLPISFLRQLIGFYGNNLQWMVPKYLEQSMDSFISNQGNIQDYFKSSLGNMFPFGSTFEEMSKQNLAMFENTMRMFSPFGGSFGSTSNNSSKASDSSSSPSASFASLSPSVVAPVNAPASSCSVNKSSSTSNESNNSNSASSSAAACSTSSASCTSDKPVASVTSLKPRNDSSSSSSSASNTPMPNVATLTAMSSIADSDDMQQKIANLQRQLADLAKSRA